MIFHKNSKLKLEIETIEITSSEILGHIFLKVISLISFVMSRKDESSFTVKWSFREFFCLIFRHFNCHARENLLAAVKVKYLLTPTVGKEFHFPESSGGKKSKSVKTVGIIRSKIWIGTSVCH